MALSLNRLLSESPMKRLTKHIFVLLVAILIIFMATSEASAQSRSAGASAQLALATVHKVQDERVVALTKYLENYESPLAPYASDFVESADRHNLDWRLVAAISGLESGFGKHIPYNSYNGWGWGVYGDNVIRFASWSEGIETISKGLRQRYLKDRVESDPYFIGPTYASSPTWAQRVDYFMQRIGEFKIANDRQVLSISI